MAREGQAQLAVYVKQPVMDGLRNYIKGSGSTLTAAIEKAIGLLLAGDTDRPVAPNAAIGNLADWANLEARVTQLEAAVQAGGLAGQALVKAPFKADADESATPVLTDCQVGQAAKKGTGGNGTRSAPQPSEVQTVMAALAASGLGPAAIAAELAKRGFTRRDGGLIHRSDQRIRKAMAQCRPMD